MLKNIIDRNNCVFNIKYYLYVFANKIKHKCMLVITLSNEYGDGAKKVVMVFESLKKWLIKTNFPGLS